MSKITLEPLDDGQKAVEIPIGKTTIGRGPFLGCGDKKVSRNHAILEVTSQGEVFLTPTHVNPCFFQPTSDSPGIILKKDKPHKLVNGDTFSLLPRAFRYKLIVNDDISNENADEGKEPSSEKRADGKVNGNAEEDKVEDESSKTEIKVSKVLEADPEREKNADTIVPDNEEASKDSSSAEDLSTVPGNEVKSSPKKEQEEPAKEVNGNDSNESIKVKSTGLDTKKCDEPKMEELDSEDSEKKDEKQLPEEVDKAEKVDERKEEEDEEEEILPEVTDKPLDSGKKKKKQFKEEAKRVEKGKDEKEVKVKNQTKVVRTKRTLPQWLLDLASAPEDYSKPVKTATKQRREKTNAKRKTEAPTSRTVSPAVNVPEKRRKKQVARRNEDDAVAQYSQRPSTGRSSRTNRQTRQGLSLEDFIASDDDEWQSDESQPRLKKRRKSRRRDDDSGSDWEIEHKKSKRPVHKYTSGSESGNEWRTKKRKTKRRRKSKRTKDSCEVISDDEEDSKSMSSKPDKRVPCQYGKKCYRRSQNHLDQHSHPGDSDYTSEPEARDENVTASEEEEDDNSERKECPYGTSCYRKNPQHRKDYKHTKKVRPQREAAKQAGKKTKVSKENDEPDTYDLNESFINDDSDEYKPVESGSEYDSSQDVERLSKGSKNIVKPKRAKRV